jgi:hypothetical protein
MSIANSDAQMALACKTQRLYARLLDQKFAIMPLMMIVMEK